MSITEMHSEQVFSFFEKCLTSNARPGTAKHLCIAQGIYKDIILFCSFLLRLHLQETASQDFIKCLKERRLGADFT